MQKRLPVINLLLTIQGKQHILINVDRIICRRCYEHAAHGGRRQPRPDEKKILSWSDLERTFQVLARWAPTRRHHLGVESTARGKTVSLFPAHLKISASSSCAPSGAPLASP